MHAEPGSFFRVNAVQVERGNQDSGSERTYLSVHARQTSHRMFCNVERTDIQQPYREKADS
jgi:hypothetical protein